MTLRGVRDEMHGDSTGTPGTPHPQIGTTFWTEGGGVSRVWTSKEDDDDPINPMLVFLGSQIYLEGLSLRTGVRSGVAGLAGSSAGWHSARFIPGTRSPSVSRQEQGCKIHETDGSYSSRVIPGCERQASDDYLPGSSNADR